MNPEQLNHKFYVLTIRGIGQLTRDVYNYSDILLETEANESPVEKEFWSLTRKFLSGAWNIG